MVLKKKIKTSNEEKDAENLKKYRFYNNPPDYSNTVIELCRF